MKLYLLRHGMAVDIAPSDAARALTTSGEAEARRAGLAMLKLGAKITHIGCSPLLRARQTAEIVAKSMQFTGAIEPLEELVNGTPTEMLLQTIQAYAGAKEFLLVGHMPSLAGHLSELVPDMVTSRSGFTTTGAACVEMKRPQVGGGRLIWFKTNRDFEKTG